MACHRVNFRQARAVSGQRTYMPQLDGLRALAMMGVMYHHWLPSSWRFHFPTEAGLFLFFVLSGFLMTQGLLKEKITMPNSAILKKFHLRRLLRIYPPYYMALAIAALLGVSEIIHAPHWWLLNAQNFLILHMGYWPPGVSHFWTLAVEQQYYLVWPLVILWTPRRALPVVLMILALMSPLTRYSSDSGGWLSMDLIPWGLLDNFALGSLLALFIHRGVKFPHRLMDLVGLLALVGYGYLYISWEMHHAVPGWCHFQQTLLAMAFTCLISRAAQGKCGIFSYLLENPYLVKLGQYSYGVYLFHNLAPLIAGKIFWFLWDERLPANIAIVIRVPFFLLITWFLTWFCQRFVERRFQAIRV